MTDAPTPCTHPHLTHVVNLELGGLDSTTYRCQECKELLTVTTKLLILEVSHGRPPHLP